MDLRYELSLLANLGERMRYIEILNFEKLFLKYIIISPMRKSQKNKLQKLSVSRYESGVLQTEWLYSEWYFEYGICFDVAFQMSRATHKHIQEHNISLIPTWDAILTLLRKNLEYFPVSQYLHSFGCSGSHKAFLVLNSFNYEGFLFLQEY